MRQARPTGRLATAEQLKALHGNGHEIACHTFSAYAGRRHQPASAGERPRSQSLFFLQGILGNIPFSNFAYPYGDISFAAKRYLGGRYDSCRATTPGVNADVADLGVFKCNALEQTSIGRQGVSHLITETVRRNGWLVFASHDVNDAPSQYGVRPDLPDLRFAQRARGRMPACHRRASASHPARRRTDGEAA